MWVRTAFDSDMQTQKLINLNKIDVVVIEVMGNVGRILACFPDETTITLGEYRDYAAKKVFEELSLFVGQDKTYFMPEEDAANEKYKEA